MTDIDLTVTENVTAALDRAIALGEDLTPAMKAIVVMMTAATRDNFDAQASPVGVPWQKRKPHPGKADFPHPILNLSGDLRDSQRENWGPDFAESGPETSGGAGIYARIHQLGGVIRPRADNKSGVLNTPFGFLKSVTMPARPYLGWNDRMRERAVDILLQFVRDRFESDSGPETALS